MIEIYVDGACSQFNHSGHGPGGWAAMLLLGREPIEISGGEPDTTNNRMEMRAVIEGLRHLGPAKQDVTVFTDSAYVCNCFRDRWYLKWQRNNWKIGSKPVANRDLWEAILDLIAHHNVIFKKVKGHSTNKFNNRCDQLAVAEAAKFARR